MKRTESGGAPRGWSWRSGDALLVPVSALLATVFFASGVRSGVVRRNLELMRLEPGPFFRWRLGFHAAYGLLGLLAPWAFRAPVVSPRTRLRLAALRRGPGLLLTAHFRNWEAQAEAWSRLGVPLLGAARPLKGAGPHILLNRVRRRRGIRVVSRDVPRKALRHLRAGGCFGLLWDQHAPDSRVPGSFAEAPVTLNPLPFFLLEKHPCPVWFGVRLSGGEMRLIRLMDRFDEGWHDRLQQRYHRVLHLLVRRAPDRWFGFLHARFKNLGPYPGHRRAQGGRAIPAPVCP